ncbi:MAG: hypothetical protein IJ371_00330 [Clostridia bacterium]|nr:hypothetical protein [Clostridia bacterium]
MKKRILSGLTAFVICAIMLVSPLSMPAYAVTTGENAGVGNLWNEFKNSEYSTVDEFLNNNVSDFRSGSFGAERGGSFGTPKRYYSGSSSGSTTTTTPSNNTLIRTVYESGQTVYTPIVTEHKTYNTTTNTYDYHYTYNDFITNTTNISNYDITNIEYSPTYNLYKLTTNVTNYYVSNNYTYVTVIYNNADTDEDIYQELYYELPDGRNSFDLTADDVFGEYFIYNVKNYNQVLEDDGVTTGLFHLDGTLSDSSGSNVGSNLIFSQLVYDEGIFGNAVVQSITSPDSRNVVWENALGKTFEYWVYYSSYVYTAKSETKNISTVYPTHLVDETSGSNKVYYGLPTNTWCHVAMVKNDNGGYSYYYNGRYQGVVSGLYAIGNYAYQYPSGEGYMAYSSVFGIDEFRISNDYIYTENFTPQQQPFDTNSVLVLPDTANENDIYIKSKYPLSDYRVGGVRPTYPSENFVYIYLEDDVVKDIQQYQEDGWYSVDARIYSNGEFIDLKNYDLSSHTVADDANSGNDDNNGGGGSSGDDNDSSGDSSGTDADFSILGKLVDLITGFIGELFSSVLGGVLDLVQILIDNLNGLLDSFTGITGLIGSLFGFFPVEMVTVLTIGLSAIFILAIIKMFKR